MNDNLLTTISRDDLFQWERLNKFVFERAIGVQNEYFVSSSHCYVEKVTISEDRKTVHVIGSVFDCSTKIDDFDIEVPTSIFLANDWKEKLNKLWILEKQMKDLKKQIAELEK